MDLDAVRAFVAAVDTGRFQDAAAELSITQQAVSKRIAALERNLGVRLFDRTPRGARPTFDGQAFLPHARELLRVAARAADSVRPERRPLRVDVIGRRIAPAGLLRGFHRVRPVADLHVMTLVDFDDAISAVESGEVDATFRAVAADRLPEGIESVRVLDEPHHLLVGPAHPLADADRITPADLVGHRIWIPGIAPGTEWGWYYEELASAFGLTIDAGGPNFGTEALFDALVEPDGPATLIGHQSRLLWPDDYDLRSIPVVDPIPMYPHSLVWRADNFHPVLADLREHLGVAQSRPDTWTPRWSRPRR